MITYDDIRDDPGSYGLDRLKQTYALPDVMCADGSVVSWSVESVDVAGGRKWACRISGDGGDCYMLGVGDAAGDAVDGDVTPRFFDTAQEALDAIMEIARAD